MSRAFRGILSQLVPDRDPDDLAIDLTARWSVRSVTQSPPGSSRRCPTPDKFVHDNVELFLSTIAALEHL